MIDLRQPLQIHVVGAGGAGMSAIAAVLAAMGHQVSGSDLKDSPGLDRLRAAGVTVTVGHDEANVAGADLVAVSTAIPERNVEFLAAGQQSIPVVRRATVLAAIAELRDTVAVAGTHGKTTTSSMLALALRAGGLAPSFIIGGDVNEIGSGAAWTDGNLFVVEADESDGTFLELPRHGAVVTNVEPDHLEHYGDFAGLQRAFERFVDDTPGPIVVGVDDDGGRALARGRDALLTYGEHESARVHMADVAAGRDGVSFTLVRDGVELGRIDLAVPGRHNARNATGAAVVALEYGASFESVADALARYAGVARRFEHRGAAAGITFIDDYAHLPTEVDAALSAATDGAWPRVVCVFQPHRYSRTQQVGADFATSFDGADRLIVTDVYSAGEPPRPGVSGKLVVDAVRRARPDLDVDYVPHRADLAAYLLGTLTEGDLCLTLGAGDLSLLPDELLARLRER